MKTFHSSSAQPKLFQYSPDVLRQLLSEIGASYNDLASAVGVSPAAVAGWLSYKSEAPQYVQLIVQAANGLPVSVVQSAIWGAMSGFASAQQRESWRKHMRLTAAQAAKIFGLSRQTWLHGGDLTDRRIGIILSLLKRRKDQWEVVQSWIEKEE